MSAIPSYCSLRSPGRTIRPLCKILEELGLAPRYEARFPWLTLPNVIGEGSPDELRVAEALTDHAASTVSRLRRDLELGAPKRGRHRKADCDLAKLLQPMSTVLSLDIWLADLGLAIEFDERQHFSEERRVSLDAYPDDDFPFSVSRWRSECSSVIYDPTPPSRDWRRAFRDSVRDLRCRAHGLRLIRLNYKDSLDRVGELLMASE